jgi:hypothetical protein
MEYNLEMRVIDAIIEAMQNLGGKAKLKDLYLEVNKYRKTPEHSIRGRLYEYSSDCDIYKKSNPDLFVSSKGKGKGEWAFRTKSLSEETTWLNEVINIKCFAVGKKYKKKEDIRKIAKLSPSSGPREPWGGVVRLANAILLFVNLDKGNAEKSLKFNDFFDGSDFFWEAQNQNTINTSHIKEMLDNAPIYLFCRVNTKKDFVYMGGLNAVNFDDRVSPIEFQFEVLDYQDNPNKDLKEIYEWKKDTAINIPEFSTNGLKKPNRKTAQGYIRDEKKKKAIELHAMDRADIYYSSLGYQVIDRSDTKNIGYDLLCIKGKELVEVEVKGTQSSGEEVIVTKNEVNNAKEQNNQADLFITYKIQLVLEEGSYKVLESKEKVIEKWNPKDSDLTALTFRYKVNGVIKLI